MAPNNSTNIVTTLKLFVTQLSVKNSSFSKHLVRNLRPIYIEQFKSYLILKCKDVYPDFVPLYTVTDRLCTET